MCNRRPPPPASFRPKDTNLPNAFQYITDCDIEEATENINIVELDDDKDFDIQGVAKKK